MPQPTTAKLPPILREVERLTKMAAKGCKVPVLQREITNVVTTLQRAPEIDLTAFREDMEQVVEDLITGYEAAAESIDDMDGGEKAKASARLGLAPLAALRDGFAAELGRLRA